MRSRRDRFGPGISSYLPIQRYSHQAYPIARMFTRIQGQVSQYSLPIFAHYVMRWSRVVNRRLHDRTSESRGSPIPHRQDYLQHRRDATRRACAAILPVTTTGRAGTNKVRRADSQAEAPYGICSYQRRKAPSTVQRAVPLRLAHQSPLRIAPPRLGLV